MNTVFNIANLEELSLPAKKIQSLLKQHDIFIFEGEMGAGKTTLISAVCSLLGINEVSSPTYAIVNYYKSSKLGAVYHFDCYRLKDENEAIESGLDELLDSGSPCFIEWANKIENLLPERYVKVKIEPYNNFRKITLSV